MFGDIHPGWRDLDHPLELRTDPALRPLSVRGTTSTENEDTVMTQGVAVVDILVSLKDVSRYLGEVEGLISTLTDGSVGRGITAQTPIQIL